MAPAPGIGILLLPKEAIGNVWRRLGVDVTHAGKHGFGSRGIGQGSGRSDVNLGGGKDLSGSQVAQLRAGSPARMPGQRTHQAYAPGPDLTPFTIQETTAHRPQAQSIPADSKERKRVVKGKRV